MRDREGPSRERSYAIAPSYRRDDREVDSRPEPTALEVVRSKFAAATEALTSSVGSGIRGLEAAQPTAGDRRRPVDCRRAYDESRAGIESALRRAETAKQFAADHGKQHGLDTSAELAAYNKQLLDAKQQLEQAPKAPPRFQRVPGEADIRAALQLPPGEQRNTELALLFSVLDRFSARTLHHRIDQKDPEDEIAQEFAHIVGARPLLLGILEGTRRIKIDAKKLPGTARGAAAAKPSSLEATEEPAPASHDKTGPEAPAVQRKAVSGGVGPAPAPSPELAAQRGFTGASEPLPFGEQIQKSFGRHDVSDVRTYQGATAKESADQLGAEAYTSGRRIAFGQAPDLRTASHEAAHAVQQRFGVQLLGGIDGGADDPYEQHADQVAEAVVAGRSAEPLLDRMPGGAGASAGVQRSPKPGAAIAHDNTGHDETGHDDTGAHAESVPARGAYVVEQAGGSYRFVFNTFDRNGWSLPVLTGLRYYMHQVFPGAGDPVIRAVLGALKIRLEGNGSSPLPVDRRYELTVDPKIHESVLVWMSMHHPELAPHAPKLGVGALRSVDTGDAAKADDGAHHAKGAKPAHDGSAHAESLAADAADTHARPGATHAREGGTKDGSLHGETAGDEHGWHRWTPKGDLRLQPAQPTYIAGSTISTELAWDLSVHPDAGQVLLPQHCTYAWTVHRGGKLVSSDGRSVLGDDRRAELRLGSEPGTYAIEVTATSPHFKAARQRFSSRTVVNVVSEQAFDRHAFDAAQVAGPDAAFTRDGQGALHLRPGQTPRTTQDEIGRVDLSRGGIDALEAQGKIGREDHDVAASELDKQRAELVQIQAQVADGTPYVVRGTFVSREDSSTTQLQLMMHVLRRSESGHEARYELVLHDTTFGEPAQHPGGAPGRVDPAAPRAAYGMMEAEALERMADHFHAHNVYPRGTVHLAVQRLTSGEVWERLFDTDNGRKTAKRILGGAALVGGAALMIVPGGTTVSAGLLVLASGAGIASVAADLEDRLAQGQVKLDHRLAMDVLQVAAIALPFGTLTRTFAAAQPIAKTGFALCMVGLDAAQGFVIAADAKQKLSVIDASTAVDLASAANDEQRKAIHAERDRRVAEVLGGAVVNGGLLLVSLGAGLKNVVAAKGHGATAAVGGPVRELATTGGPSTDEALSTGSYEHAGERTELNVEERWFLEHQTTPHERSATSGAPYEGALTPTTIVGIENRGEPYADPRLNPDLPREYLPRRQLRTYEKMGAVSSWKDVERTLHHGETSCAIGKKIKSEQQGHELLQRLAAGDSSALELLGVSGIPKETNLSLREWVLVQGRDGYAIYAGKHSSVKLPNDVRVLAHNHPNPSPGALAEGREIADLQVGAGGLDYAAILRNPDAAKRAGILPSIADIHAISDGSAHVIYTRYIHLGNGNITNPSAALREPRVSLHLSGTSVLRWNPRIHEYWYEVAMSVKDSSGQLLWSGKLFGQWHANAGMGTVFADKPAVLDRPLPSGWSAQ